MAPADPINMRDYHGLREHKPFLPDDVRRRVEEELTGPPPLPLPWFRELTVNLFTGDFVEGLLVDDTIAEVYGETSSSKTFFVLDLLLHVAAGRPWQGRAVDTDPVLYLALEGGKGVVDRVCAMRDQLGLPPDTPFSLVTGAQFGINLLRDGEDARIIEALWALEARHGIKPVLAVDTLSRAMLGGDENSSDGMGTVVSRFDAIRRATGCCIILVHHTGKDLSRGARGHSSLRGAMDTEIVITKGEDGACLMRVAKQRDLPDGDRFGFRLHQVELGLNERGKPVTTWIVEPCDPPAEAGAKRARMHPEAQSLFRHVQDALAGPEGQTGKPDALMVADVRCVERRTLHAILVQKGWLVPKGAGKLAGELAIGESAERRVGDPEYKRLYKRLTALQSNGLVAFVRRFVWLPERVAA